MKYSTIAIIVLLVSSLAVSGQSMFDKVNDFDGDGRADFAVTRNEGGLKIWYISQTTAGFRRLHWGLDPNDSLAAGDYDGDGKTDPAVLRRNDISPTEANCVFHILRSTAGDYQTRALPLSLPFESVCVPIEQDYDADGKTDPAIWQGPVIGSVSYYRSATNSVAFSQLPALHLAVTVGDLDGDASAEITSYIEQVPRLVRKQNPVSGTTTSVQWGISGDIYVPADFDGDNIGDLTIFRPSSGDWWWLRSSDGTVSVSHWGENGDVPVPADYDGDGKTDRAVYRLGTPNMVYYIDGSLTGFRIFIWGIPGDAVVRY